MPVHGNSDLLVHTVKRILSEQTVSELKLIVLDDSQKCVEEHAFGLALGPLASNLKKLTYWCPHGKVRYTSNVAFCA